MLGVFAEFAHAARRAEPSPAGAVPAPRLCRDDGSLPRCCGLSRTARRRPAPFAAESGARSREPPRTSRPSDRPRPRALRHGQGSSSACGRRGGDRRHRRHRVRLLLFGGGPALTAPTVSARPRSAPRICQPGAPNRILRFVEEKQRADARTTLPLARSGSGGGAALVERRAPRGSRSACWRCRPVTALAHPGRS